MEKKAQEGSPAAAPTIKAPTRCWECHALTYENGLCFGCARAEEIREAGGLLAWQWQEEERINYEIDSGFYRNL